MGYCTYPREMTQAEAKAYLDRSKRKFGESNIAHVSIRLYGDTVEICTQLKDDARERIRRLSPETIQELGKGA